MGLDFTHGEAHWSYSGFMRFRRDLAQAIGINLFEMEGFYGVDTGDYRNAMNGKSWDTVTDPLKLLIYHSDCDGELTVEECKQVGPRLREVLNRLPNEYDRQEGELLIEGMKLAIEEGVPLEFV